MVAASVADLTAEEEAPPSANGTKAKRPVSHRFEKAEAGKLHDAEPDTASVDDNSTAAVEKCVDRPAETTGGGPFRPSHGHPDGSAP